MGTDKKEKRKLFKRLLSYISPYKSKIYIVIFCVIITTITGFFQPLIVRRITDDGMYMKNLSVIISSVLLIVLIVLLEQGIELLLTNIFAEIHNKSYYELLHQAFNKILHLKMKYFEDKNTSEILDSIQMDVENISLITDRYIIMSLSQVFKVISGVAGLMIISWKLTVIVLAMVPIKYVTVKFFAKEREKKLKKCLSSTETIHHGLEIILTGLKK